MRRMRRWGAAPLVAMAITLSPGVAGAESCPSTIAGDSNLEGGDAAARYRFIDATMTRESRKGRIWNRAWGWGLVGTAVGQVGIGMLLPEDECPRCWYASAGKATLGVTSTFLFTPVRIGDVPHLDAAPTCDELAVAEAALVAAAKSENVHWLRHAEGIAVNLAATLYMGLELDEWGKAALSFASGFVVGELRLYTRPDGAVHALKRYRAGDVGASPSGATAWGIVPAFYRDAYTLNLTVIF